MHKQQGRARPQSGDQPHTGTQRTPLRRAQRWLGALVLGPALLSGALLLLHGCTLPAPIQPATAAAGSQLAAGPLAAPRTGAEGEPEVVFMPIIEAQPIAAARLEQPVAAAALVEPHAPEARMPARGEIVESASSAIVRTPVAANAPAGLAGLAAAHENPPFPSATPTIPADATASAEALPVPPLPTADAAAPPATLSITEALAITLPISAGVSVATDASAPAAAATEAPAPDYAPDGVARSATVPILMYHYVSTPPADADIYRRDLSVAPDLFAAQLDRLQAEGYTTISLYDLMAHLGQGAPLPEKPVILTFDDGYRDLYENALPALRDRGMKATVFVLTDFMDEGRPEYLTWEMAREMLAAGISIESHGRNHVSLKGKDRDYLIWQALGSEETIAFELGVRPRFVSYPAGEFDQSVIDVFASANYWAGVTTVQGTAHASDDPFRLTRLRVRGTTSPDDLIRLLAADW